MEKGWLNFMKTMSKRSVVLMAMAMLTLFTLFAFVQSNQHTASAKTRTRSRFSRIYRVARRKLGRPYVYGAAGPNRFDCSGFVKYVYRHGAHKRLARTAQMQYRHGRKIRARHARRGDLVFFGGSKYSIYHVGIIIGKNRMIDAQNRGVVTEAIHAPWWHVVGYARV